MVLRQILQPSFLIGGLSVISLFGSSCRINKPEGNSLASKKPIYCSAIYEQLKPTQIFHLSISQPYLAHLSL